MKRKIILLAAVIVCLALAACGRSTATKPIPPETRAGSESSEETAVSRPESTDAPEAEKEAAPQSIALVGPWHLDDEKNDLAAFADSLDLFPGYGEWGAGMEIRGNGEMSWYIGAESWHGTYTAEGKTIHAQLISDLEQSEQFWDLRIAVENEKVILEMPYNDRTIYWVYGDWED